MFNYPASLSIPRLYAAASLKLGGSVACGTCLRISIPRLYAAASLKPRTDGVGVGVRRGVFRGSMPRPH